MSIKIRRLDASSPDFPEQLKTLLAFEAGEDGAIDQAVARLLKDVKTRGDEAVLHYTQQFDRFT